jgi:hypothetical protein
MAPEQSLKRARPESDLFANARARTRAHRRRALATKKDLIRNKSESGLRIAPGGRRALAEQPYGAPWTPASGPEAQGRETKVCWRPSTRLHAVTKASASAA